MGKNIPFFIQAYHNALSPIECIELFPDTLELKLNVSSNGAPSTYNNLILAKILESVTDCT